MTEEQLQAECFKWHWNTFPQHRYKLFHVPNGGKRDKREAMKFKGMGVISGVSDFIYLIEGYYYAIELKSLNGRTSPKQRRFAEAIGMERFYLVNSLDQFKNAILEIHETVDSLKKYT